MVRETVKGDMEMITMDQINDIRYLTKIQRLSYSKVKITGCSYETIKIWRIEDLTPIFKAPLNKNKTRWF